MTDETPAPEVNHPADKPDPPASPQKAQSAQGEPNVTPAEGTPA
jgi:hypothetical protein